MAEGQLGVVAKRATQVRQVGEGVADCEDQLRAHTAARVQRAWQTRVSLEAAMATGKGSTPHAFRLAMHGHLAVAGMAQASCWRQGVHGAPHGWQPRPLAHHQRSGGDSQVVGVALIVHLVAPQLAAVAGIPGGAQPALGHSATAASEWQAVNGQPAAPPASPVLNLHHDASLHQQPEQQLGQMQAQLLAQRCVHHQLHRGPGNAASKTCTGPGNAASHLTSLPET